MSSQVAEGVIRFLDSIASSTDISDIYEVTEYLDTIPSTSLPSTCRSVYTEAKDRLEDLKNWAPVQYDGENINCVRQQQELQAICTTYSSLIRQGLSEANMFEPQGCCTTC